MRSVSFTSHVLRLMIASFVILGGGSLSAQGGPWSLSAGNSSNPLHSGAQGGAHETVSVTNNNTPDGQASNVTMEVKYYDANGTVKQVNITIPEGQTGSFKGDIKSMRVIGDGLVATNGTYSVTYPLEE
jgi:hypothetical protein